MKTLWVREVTHAQTKNIIDHKIISPKKLLIRPETQALPLNSLIASPINQMNFRQDDPGF